MICAGCNEPFDRPPVVVGVDQFCRACAASFVVPVPKVFCDCSRGRQWLCNRACVMVIAAIDAPPMSAWAVSE